VITSIEGTQVSLPRYLAGGIGVSLFCAIISWALQLWGGKTQSVSADGDGDILSPNKSKEGSRPGRLSASETNALEMRQPAASESGALATPCLGGRSARTPCLGDRRSRTPCLGDRSTRTPCLGGRSSRDSVPRRQRAFLAGKGRPHVDPRRTPPFRIPLGAPNRPISKSPPEPQRESEITAGTAP